jgi:hypothetical protein
VHRRAHRLARLVDVLEAEPPRVAVDLATLGPAGEPARAERLEQRQPSAEPGLVAALRPREERRVVQQVVVRRLVADRVAVDDEVVVLLAVLDRLALHVARAVDHEVLDPRVREMPERPARSCRSARISSRGIDGTPAPVRPARETFATVPARPRPASRRGSSPSPRRPSCRSWSRPFGDSPSRSSSSVIAQDLELAGDQPRQMRQRSPAAHARRPRGQVAQERLDLVARSSAIRSSSSAPGPRPSPVARRPKRTPAACATPIPTTRGRAAELAPRRHVRHRARAGHPRAASSSGSSERSDAQPPGLAAVQASVFSPVGNGRCGPLPCREQPRVANS